MQMPLQPTSAQLLGTDDSQLIAHQALNCRLLPEALAALERLSARAANAGFQLKVASSYRDFSRQLLIWNGKARGARPVLDSQGVALDIAHLSERELLYAILRWSALPGASRHHWGTDLDIYDASRMPEGYRLQLTQAETCDGGVCGEFHRWLDVELAQSNSEFYRPYAHDNGGVAPEPWHLSFAPIARHYQATFSQELLYQHLTQADIALKDCILEHLPAIYRRFILTPP